MSCCAASSIADARNAEPPSLNVEFLFLDDKVCQPCSGTAQALDKAIEIAAAPLAAMGVDVQVEKIHVVDLATAETHKFLTSPTIRINGNDIDPARTEEECGTCGDLTGGETAVNCRNWHWRGQVHQTAPTGKLVEAIMDMATRSKADCCTDISGEKAYTVPENLRAFFVARESGDKHCC